MAVQSSPVTVHVFETLIVINEIKIDKPKAPTKLKLGLARWLAGGGYQAYYVLRRHMEYTVTMQN